MKLRRLLFTGAMLMIPGQLLAVGPPIPAELKAEQAALFSQADSDGNGTLSLEEFKTFESLFREKMTDHHFTRLDANGDGAVSLEELQAQGPGHGHGRRGGPPPWQP